MNIDKSEVVVVRFIVWQLLNKIIDNTIKYEYFFLIMLKDSDKKREIGQIRARRLKIKDLEKILTTSMKPHALPLKAN